MMTDKQVINLSDYNLTISRSKLKYCGIGPGLGDGTSSSSGNNGASINNKLWPRDAIQPEEECRKLFYTNLRRLVNNDDKIKVIESVIFRLSKALKQCKINQLVYKHCRLDHGYDQRAKPVDVIRALDAYTHYNKILALIHAVIASLDLDEKKKTQFNFVKLLFGCNKNFAIFKEHLKWMVKGNSRLDRMIIGQFVYSEGFQMDLDKIVWLDGLDSMNKYRIFIQVIGSLSRFIIELLRRYFYITISNPFANKLFYYRFDLWQQIRDAIIKSYLNRGVLRQVPTEEKLVPNTIVSRMKFHLKQDNLRLICSEQIRRKSDAIAIFYKLHAVLSYVDKNICSLGCFNLNSLLKSLKYIRDKSLEDNEQQIYVVRADIENCFQSIDQEKLRNIIMDCLRQKFSSGPIKVHKSFCTLKKRRGLPRTEITRWTLDLASLKMNKRYETVYRSETCDISLSDFDEHYLKPLIIRPVITESKHSKSAYRLMNGIRQGSKSSPAFCSIYIKQALSTTFGQLLDSPDFRLLFYVDDILLLTTDLNKAKLFLSHLLRGFEGFNLKSNINKLACNFDCDLSEIKGCSQVETLAPRLKDYVVFYKRKICLNKLYCTYNYDYQQISIDNSFHLSPFFNEKSIINQALRLTKIEAIHLDANLNGMHQVVVNMFESIVLTAHRVGTMIVKSYQFRDLKNQQPELLVKLIKKISLRIHRINGSCSTKLNESLVDASFDDVSDSFKERGRLVTNSLVHQEIRVIVLAAFIATWSRVKLRHRSKELETLVKFSKKAYRYLIGTGAEDETNERSLSGKPFLGLIRKLVEDFPDSSFAREVLLPDKN